MMRTILLGFLALVLAGSVLATPTVYNSHTSTTVTAKRAWTEHGYPIGVEHGNEDIVSLEYDTLEVIPWRVKRGGFMSANDTIPFVAAYTRIVMRGAQTDSTALCIIPFYDTPDNGWPLDAGGALDTIKVWIGVHADSAKSWTATRNLLKFWIYRNDTGTDSLNAKAYFVIQ